MSGRTWWNTAHGAVLGGLFLFLLLVTLLLVLQLRARDLTAEGLEHTRVWVKAACILALAAGLAAVLTGSFAVDLWFRGAGTTSPAHLLSAKGLGTWVTAERVKEWVAWASVLVAVPGGYLVLRRDDELVTPGRTRTLAMGSFTVALVLAGVAGVMGVLLTKLAPLI